MLKELCDLVALKLHELSVARAHTMNTGGCEDFAAYREAVGYIDAMDAADEAVREAYAELLRKSGEEYEGKAAA